MKEVLITRIHVSVKAGTADIFLWKHQCILKNGKLYLKRTIGRRFFRRVTQANDGRFFSVSSETYCVKEIIKKSVA